MNFKASSQDKNFGRLITSLREQHQDKYGNKWGIDTLERQCGMLSANILRKIERGEKAKRDIDLLNTLAKGLQLAESERKEFFLAAVQMAEPASPLSVQECNEMRTAFDRLLYIPMPALIMDAYCDILAANNLMESLYQITPETRSTYLVKPAGNNLLHIVYGFPEFKDRFGKNWSDIAFNNLIFFRRVSLRYRATPYFAELLDVLLSFDDFSKEWHSSFMRQKSQPLNESFTDDNYNFYNFAPNLRFLALNTPILKRFGELYLLTYSPANIETQATIQAMLQQLPLFVDQIDHQYPQKIAHWKK